LLSLFQVRPVKLQNAYTNDVPVLWWPIRAIGQAPAAMYFDLVDHHALDRTDLFLVGAINGSAVYFVATDQRMGCFPCFKSRRHEEFPPVRSPASLAVLVALAFHELATNAAKYGALSDLAGVLAVTWRVEGEKERILHIEWIENDGPPVVAPTREGFGSRLLNKVLPAQAYATIKMDFAPTGLRASISLPLVGIENG
jgi:hypothetical protein